MRRGPDWLGYLYMNMAIELNSVHFAAVAQMYFARGRRWANGIRDGKWYD